MQVELLPNRPRPTKPNYGIDAPTIIIRWGTVGIILLIAGILTSIFLPSNEVYGIVVPIILFSFAGSLLVPSVTILFGSLFFKFWDREWLFKNLALEGHENILDVGCGHGLLLIGAAKRLNNGGRSYGLDLWSQDDQASNNKQDTMINAELEGVADRVEIHDGDMRQMPFEEHKFDAVVSSWAIHNIYDKEGRAKTLQEIVRVLKPGGRIAILDIDHGPEYEKYFKSQEEVGVLEKGSVHKLGPHLTFGNFTYLILATKSTQQA